ncbi:hypothetical protein CHS0354_023242 [Potamilus streckersoni]|uniref:Uncharacterized protein n=1 Tax=Potamilus streckersoni TaxID=2493646 RepID=A0AAE0TAD1_9BIVA|nr:hypothetical protein CHS0354_023242 [Potamilus streckersoni]
MVVVQGKQKKKQPIVTVDTSDKGLLEENLPGLTTCGEKSSFGLDLLSASAPVSSEGYVPTTYRAFIEAPTALNASTTASTMQSCDSDLQSSLLTVQVDNEIMFSLCAEICKLLSSEESPSISCNSLPYTATSVWNFMLG